MKLYDSLNLNMHLLCSKSRPSAANIVVLRPHKICVCVCVCVRARALVCLTMHTDMCMVEFQQIMYIHFHFQR